MSAADARAGGASGELPRDAADQPAPGATPRDAMPQWLTERCTSRGGVPLCIRPLGPGDAAAERAFIARLSPMSLHQRLLGVVTEVSDEQIAELVRQQWPQRLGLAAFACDAEPGDAQQGGAQAGAQAGTQAGAQGPAAAGDLPSAAEGILGVTRFDVGERPEAAEFAIVVADRWQRHGIGYALFQKLVRAARAAGYRELVGITYAVNREMVELARSYGFAVGPEEGEPSLRRLTLRL